MTLPRFLISLLRSPPSPRSLPHSPCSPPTQHPAPAWPQAPRWHPAPRRLLQPHHPAGTWENHRARLRATRARNPSPMADHARVAMPVHPDPGDRPTEPSPAGFPSGMHPGLWHGAAPRLEVPQDPPACCAWMSLLYTASADSISVRLVWIIWGEGCCEELGRADGEKGLGQGLPLASAWSPGSGSPHPAVHSRVWCDPA